MNEMLSKIRPTSVGMINKLSVASIILASICVVGCGGKAEAPAASSAAASSPTKHLSLSGVAGYPVKRDDLKPGQLVALEQGARARYGAARKDPFALTSSEQKFEEAQAAERLLTSTGSWQLDYEEPEDKDKNVRYQAQPPRRLMGIVIGDAVYAVIDMGDGRGRIIHPGMQVPDSEWYVVSIDEEKAILRRGGDVFPKEVTVKLQSSSALISSGGGAAGGGGQRNGAGGGMPGKGKGGFGANPGGGDDIN